MYFHNPHLYLQASTTHLYLQASTSFEAYKLQNWKKSSKTLP